MFAIEFPTSFWTISSVVGQTSASVISANVEFSMLASLSVFEIFDVLEFSTLLELVFKSVISFSISLL